MSDELGKSLQYSVNQKFGHGVSIYNNNRHIKYYSQ